MRASRKLPKGRTPDQVGLGTLAWGDVPCPLCGVEPKQFCKKWPRLARRFPWLASTVWWPCRWHEHNERITLYIMKHDL